MALGRQLILCLALAGCTRATPPQTAVDTTPPNAASEVPWHSPEGLSAMGARLAPLIEAHAGRTFTALPPVEVMDPEAFQSYAQKEAELISERILADTPEHVRKRAAQTRMSTAGLYGKYGLFTETTYVVPTTIERAAARTGVEAQALATVVLTHELVHALQHDHSSEGHGLDAIADQDQFHAWHAVSEGGANWVTLKVATELGIEDVFWILSKSQGWGRDGLLEPAAYPLYYAYGLGMETLDQVVEREGLEGFWRWHTATPRTSAVIFAPETYGAPLPDDEEDFAAVLRGTEQLLTKGDWLVANSRLGAFDLRGIAIRTGKIPEFEKVLAHLEQAQHLVLSLPDREGDIAVLRFDAPESAARFVALLRAEQTVEGQILAKQLGRPVEVTYTTIDDVPGDASLLRTQRVPSIGGVVGETRTGWVARGDTVVVVHAERFRPGLRLQRTLEGVFERLDASRSD